MTLQNIFDRVTDDIDDISEIDLIIKIQEFTQYSFDRSCSGYRMMRANGIINDKIQKWTIGQLETLESNTGIMLVISKFDCIPTNIQIKKLNTKVLKKAIECERHELVPLMNMTRLQIAIWICKPNKPTDSQMYAEFKRLYD